MKMLDSFLGKTETEPVAVPTAEAPAAPGLTTAPPQTLDISTSNLRPRPPQAPPQRKPQWQQQRSQGTKRHRMADDWDVTAPPAYEEIKLKEDSWAELCRLRMTFGGGLASGQLLVKTYPEYALDKPCQFFVMAGLLPTQEQRLQDGPPGHVTERIFFDRGPYVKDAKKLAIMEIKVETVRLRKGEVAPEGQTPIARWVRMCGVELGNPYQDRQRHTLIPWTPMDEANLQLQIHNPDILAAVAAFTGIQYVPWVWEDKVWTNNTLTYEDKAKFSHKTYLA